MPHRRGEGGRAVRGIVPGMPEALSTFPDIVEIVVEIPRGSRNKYEYDEGAGSSGSTAS